MKKISQYLRTIIASTLSTTADIYSNMNFSQIITNIIILGGGAIALSFAIYELRKANKEADIKEKELELINRWNFYTQKQTILKSENETPFADVLEKFTLREIVFLGKKGFCVYDFDMVHLSFCNLMDKIIDLNSNGKLLTVDGDLNFNQEIEDLRK